jgi:hypothetical protein
LTLGLAYLGVQKYHKASELVSVQVILRLNINSIMIGSSMC